MTTPTPGGHTPGKVAAIRRQELRRSNAAVPIPAGKHKRSRSMQKQALKREYATAQLRGL